MICPICREEIKLQKLNSHFKITLGNLINGLNSHFKITLGNLINGKFYGNKTFYYHRDCLSEKNLNERELLIV